MSMSWSPLQPTRHRRPCSMALQDLLPRSPAAPIPNTSTKTSFRCALYAECKNPVRRIGFGVLRRTTGCSQSEPTCAFRLA